MRSLPALLLALLLAVVPACRSAAPAPALPLPSEAEAHAAAGQASTLGPGDLVEVRVFQEPDHSGVWRVSPEGTIDYPLCGKVALAGRTSSTAADALRECLARYLRRPQVSVLIREYNSKKIFVFGEVQKPGTFPYDGEMSIIQAITLAGGFTKTAAQNSTHVTRLVNGQERKIRVPVEDIGVGREKNFLLQPGDIVFVPESFF
ncbi:MAG: polysaccharide biosynthesis/export family protein [Hyalangium sp.]|uniref:polysaccharide biosynthesis/export family protein n=1 Tax=Hyalangium sp. TaxID=2028555 RepID=UPI00389AE2D8